MSEKSLLERRNEKISQTQYFLPCEKNPLAKEKWPRKIIVQGKPRKSVRNENNKTRKINIMKNYHKLKKNGRLTKQGCHSIETCLHIGTGIDEEKEEIIFDLITPNDAPRHFQRICLIFC